jgi:hypothetical protein
LHSRNNFRVCRIVELDNRIHCRMRRPHHIHDSSEYHMQCGRDSRYIWLRFWSLYVSHCL